MKYAWALVLWRPSSPPQPQKDGIVLHCLIVLEAKINDLFLRMWACLWVGLCVVFSGGKKTTTKWLVVNENITGWKNWKEINVDSKVSVGWKERWRNRKCKKVREPEKNTETLLGTVNRGNNHWLIVSLCHTEPIPGDLCVCVSSGFGWGAQGLSCCQSRGPRACFGCTPAIPYCETTSTTIGGPPFCGTFFWPSTLFSIYDCICLAAQESEVMGF